MLDMGVSVSQYLIFVFSMTILGELGLQWIYYYRFKCVYNVDKKNHNILKVANCLFVKKAANPNKVS